MHLPVNTLLQGGRYRIVRFIGSGGFGCTYEGEHVLLEKRVAIKEFFVKDFCNRDETSQSVSVATKGKKALVEKLRHKFIDEARSLCRLHHPGIVSVFDVFEENGTAYFVMDYVDGRSLGSILRESGHLSEKQAVRYIMQVAESLRYVHDNNRLHLDIKPDNIMIDASGNAVLIDFGASKQYDEAEGENTSTLLGKTPGYAPMEQMGNDVVRFLPATDIYALGATLYKLLTGTTPLSATLIASGEELPPLPATVSENVHKAVAAAMQINKTRRPQTVDEFMKILSSIPSGDTDNDDDTVFDDIPEAPGTTPETIKIVSDAGAYTPETAEIPRPLFQTDDGWDNGRRKRIFIIAAVIVVIVAIFMIYRCSAGGRTDSEVPVSVIPDTVSGTEDIPTENDLNAPEENAAKNDNQTGTDISQPSAIAQEKKMNNNTRAESRPVETISDESQDTSIPEFPEFPGGKSALSVYISNNLRYPADAMESGVEGQVLVGIVVNTDGSLASATIVRSLDPELDREALRVIRNMPRWNPGKNRIKYTLPISFKLT